MPLLLLATFFSAHLFAEPIHICRTYLDVSYCVSRAQESQNKDVVYFFHGSFGSEKRWTEGAIYRGLYDYWRDYKLDPPTVVSVSYGPVWALLEEAPNPQSARLKHFMNEFVPYVETQYSLTGRRRFVMGESMGGYNALQIYFRHPEFAAGVLALCPAIWTISPWSSFGSVIEYRNRTGASYFKIFQMLAVVRWGFVNQDTWASGDPLKLVDTLDPQRPRLYLSYNREDRFGLAPATEEFARKAELNHGQVYLDNVGGDHCSAINYYNVSLFLDMERP